MTVLQEPLPSSAGPSASHDQSLTKLVLLLGSLALLLLPASRSAADVYRYVDENEVIHLTNLPMGPPFRLLFKEGRPDSEFAYTSVPYGALIATTADKYGVDHALVKAVIKAESNFNRNAVSKKGARGLMQLMPQTALAFGVTDCFRPEENIEGGIRYLSYLIGLYNGDLRLTLAAYNAGEAAVAKYFGIPPYEETRTYVRQVLNHYERYRRESTLIASASSAALKQPRAKQGRLSSPR